MKRNLANIEFPPCMFINPFSGYSHTIGDWELTLWELRNLVGGSPLLPDIFVRTQYTGY